MTAARTVHGDVHPASLGVVNAHDHLFFRSRMLPGHELDDTDLATTEARAFAAAGGSTIVQWTPRGLGRRRDQLAEIAVRAGVHIIAATGRHRAEHYSADATAESVDELATAFVSDIRADTAPCGLIKVGTGYHHLDAVERASLQAAALAHRATGAPVAIHLELGTAGDLVLERLHALGVAPTSIILGHVGRNPDQDMLLTLAASGSYLCFDGPSRANHRTDWRTPECIELLVHHGHTEQLLIGGDTTTAAARSVTSGPGMPGLLNRFGAGLRRRVGITAHHAITVTNPARALTLAHTTA